MPSVCAEAERTEQDDQCQRRVPDDVDVGGPSQFSIGTGESHRGQHSPEDQRPDRRERRESDRGPERLDDQAAVLAGMSTFSDAAPVVSVSSGGEAER